MTRLNLFPGLFLILSICYGASGQSIDSELTKLRDLLNVPPSIAISPSTSSLPGNHPLRVYLAIGKDPKVRKGFVSRFDEWNRKNGVEFGSLEIVSNFSEADVALVWYSTTIDRVTRPPDDRSLSETCCPSRTFSYLIIRRSDKLEMLSRIIIEGYKLPGGIGQAGDSLRAEFFKRLKSRPKT